MLDGNRHACVLRQVGCPAVLTRYACEGVCCVDDVSVGTFPTLPAARACPATKLSFLAGGRTYGHFLLRWDLRRPDYIINWNWKRQRLPHYDFSLITTNWQLLTINGAGNIWEVSKSLLLLTFPLFDPAKHPTLLILVSQHAVSHRSVNTVHKMEFGIVWV